MSYNRGDVYFQLCHRNAYSTFNYVTAMLTLYDIFYDYLVHFCFPSSVPFLCCGVKALGVFLGSDNKPVTVAVFIDVLIQ